MRCKPIITAPALLVLFVPAVVSAQTPAHLWSQSFTGGGLQMASSVAVRNTRLWVAGGFSEIDLGGAAYPSPKDDYIAMFDTDGNYQWSHAFGDAGESNTTAIGVDASDNVYITGQFNGTVNFGGTDLVSAGGYDAFLAKFNSSGVHQWSKKFGDASLNDTGLALAVDASNNVIIGGRFSGSTDFGGGGLTTAGGTDAYIAKFNSAGTHQWSKKFGDASDQEVANLATTSAGDVYATGKFFGSINFGGSNLASLGSTDAFLAKFNSTGTHQWSQRYGSGGFDYGIDVDADNTSVYLITNFNLSIDLGGGVLTGAGSQDIAVARLTSAGAHTWSKRFGDSDVQTAAAIDYAGGHVVITGYFEGTLDFGDHPLAALSQDAFLAKLSMVNGDESSSQRFGSSGSDYGLDLAFTGTRTYVAGYFNDEIDFGYGDPLISATRDADAFVAAFGSNPAEPVISTVKDLANDQGGVVTVNFQRSDYDAATTPLVIRGYEVYLREDPLPVLASRPGAQNGETWIFAGESPAHGLGSYVTLATTQADSTLTGGMHASVYKVRAVTDDPAVYFDSGVLSGYSLDNLEPGMPTEFLLADDVLSWRSADRDIAHFSVYGSDGEFDESAVLLDYATDTRLDLAGRAFANYFVTATDRAGNEGRAAALYGSASAAPVVPRVLSVSAFPNPFNPATTIRYTLPSAGPVRVDVFDATGALVRVLVDEDRPAGAYTAHWDGRNGAGAGVGSGVYFARVSHGGASRAYKMVMLK
jgi:hypothetical protein